MNTSTNFPVNPIKNSQLYSYAIIDCAQLEDDFYDTFIQQYAQYTTNTSQVTQLNKATQIESLFKGTLDEPSAKAGPILIKLDITQDSPLRQKLLSLEQQSPAVLWLWTKLDFYHLAERTLKPLLYGQLEDQSEVLIRYYDPRCTENLCKLFKEDPTTAKLINQISAWAYQEDGEYRYLIT